LGQSTDTASDSLEERVARLSISISAHAATVRSQEDREAVFAKALCAIIEEFIERGHSLHDAAVIGDDVIAAARKIVSQLIAHQAR
jgi:hypothetical protein